jgi:hypothetical protein
MPEKILDVVDDFFDKNPGRLVASEAMIMEHARDNPLTDYGESLVALQKHIHDGHLITYRKNGRSIEIKMSSLAASLRKEQMRKPRR